jgi:hypothetical protein
LLVLGFLAGEPSSALFLFAGVAAFACDLG